jgi:hypothetical protein
MRWLGDGEPRWKQRAATLTEEGDKATGGAWTSGKACLLIGAHTGGGGQKRRSGRTGTRGTLSGGAPWRRSRSGGGHCRDTPCRRGGSAVGGGHTGEGSMARKVMCRQGVGRAANQEGLGGAGFTRSWPTADTGIGTRHAQWRIGDERGWWLQDGAAWPQVQVGLAGQIGLAGPARNEKKGFFIFLKMISNQHKSR